MIHLYKALLIACSIYSKIPVPQFAWKDEDMKYTLCFFPWIGAVIGACIYIWSRWCARAAVGAICRTLIGCALPLLITGGFHADGFLDTMDAFRSYQSRERKLEILKDAHIGAFAVLMLALYGLLYAGAYSEVCEQSLLKAVCGGFFLARCLSGIGVVSLPSAKQDGMLCLFADRSHKAAVKGSLYVQGAVCICWMLRQSPYAPMLVAAALLSFLYYAVRTKKELGGITGDTAGYFILLCEGSMMLAAAACNSYFY